MEKIVLSGGVGSGKTTLFNLIKKRYSDEFNYVEEPATSVINQEKVLSSVMLREGIYPWTDPEEFANLAIAQSLYQEKKLDHSKRFSILDRSLVDNIAYSKVYGYEYMADFIKGMSMASNYSKVFFCELLGKYETTNQKEIKIIEKIHSELRKAYEETGVEIIDLPAVSTEKRFDIVEKYLSL